MLGANGASAPPTFHRRGEGRASLRAWRRAHLHLVRASLRPRLGSLLPFALFGVAYFALGPLRALPTPLPSRRLRRISFISTTYGQLQRAHDVAELWRPPDETAAGWEELWGAGLNR